MSHDPATELDPVRRALLDDAAVEVASVVAAAEADAQALVDEAQTEVEHAVDRARRRAASSAAAAAEQQLTAARRRARAELFRARSEVWNEVVDRVRIAADRLPDDPRYPALEAHLVELARAQLGEDAVIERDPAGGFVAGAGGRRVDYRMPAIADRAVAANTDEVVALWS
jgi:vacuolar-type H+-ATPase subunit E/Vma4